MRIQSSNTAVPEDAAVQHPKLQNMTIAMHQEAGSGIESSVVASGVVVLGMRTLLYLQDGVFYCSHDGRLSEGVRSTEMDGCTAVGCGMTAASAR